MEFGNDGRIITLGKHPIITSEFKDTGAIGEIKLAPFLMRNFIAFDGTTEYLIEDYKQLYELYSNVAPTWILEGSDELHFKLVSFDGRYAKGDSANAGQLGSESLPNVKGNLAGGPASGGTSGISAFVGAAGAFTGNGQHTNKPASFSSGNGNSWNNANFELATGQVDTEGNYIAKDISTYKDGAKVNPNNFTGIWQVRYAVDKCQIDCPYDVGDLLQTKNPTNPSTRWKGTTWEQVVEGNFIQLTEDSTKVGTYENEELPNIQGSVEKLGIYDTSAKGALSASNYSGNVVARGAEKWNGSKIYFNASKGQTNSDGTYKPQEESTYKDGGRVKPKSLLLYGWIRIS